MVALALMVAGISTAAADDRSVPAEFVKFVQPPGQADHFLRPSALVVDRHFHEILVADPGNNRIVVFDRHGTYRFEFGGSGYFSTPVDIAVDSEGYLYVLGTTSQGRRIFRFDFDGLYMDELALPESDVGSDITSLAIDARDRVFLLDHASLEVHVLDVAGNPLHSIPLMPGLDPELRSEQVIGAIEVKDDRLFVPISSLGQVQVYTTEGEFVRPIGHKGTIVGELNFPVAVALTQDDLVLILDKHRFTVACFDLAGKFLGEFGGKGVSPGWFYYPTLLALDEEEQVYIGQVFRSRVQVCRIPDFVRAAHLRGRLDETENAADQDDFSQSTTTGSSQPRGGNVPRENDASSIPESARNVRYETTLH